MDYKSFINRYIKRHPVNAFLLFLNLAFLIADIFASLIFQIDLVSWGAIHPQSILEGHEYYRIITAMFLHANILHFLSNMIVLYYLGGHMEKLIGPQKYALLYVASGLASSIVVSLFGSGYTVGASGAIYGVMGGLFMLTILRKYWFHPKAISSIQQLMALNLILTFVIPNISVYGHLGGLLMGVILFFFITPLRPYFFDERL